ncbi:hypothetical protein SAY87_012183 [Trapa incisa]|uniref:Non-specific serine/threonine protein kinase n=1 Tax=Trapa incisa TaxID=236973 RepID=A0AAN7GH29_9MYRT|nr:hypothetical protein SAY87_012183 [Trapa incisa]
MKKICSLFTSPFPVFNGTLEIHNFTILPSLTCLNLSTNGLEGSVPRALVAFPSSEFSDLFEGSSSSTTSVSTSQQP